MGRRDYESMIGGSVASRDDAMRIIAAHKAKYPGVFSYRIVTAGEAYGHTRYMPQYRRR